MRSVSEIEGRVDDIYDAADDDSKELGHAVHSEAMVLDWVLGCVDSPVDELPCTNRLATEEEVRRCVDLLRQQRQSTPEFSYFGDDNWGSIDGQIRTLEWVLGEESKR